MGTYTGTALNDTITPETVSAGVTCVPAGTRPSAAADTISGLGGNDVLDGGGGADTINGGDGNDRITDYSAGNIIHGNGGADDIQIKIYDSGGSNPVGNTAYGDDGDDEVSFAVSVLGAPDGEWLGSAPTGTVSLYGGVGNDRLAVNGYYVGDASGMTVNQYGGAGNDVLRASADEYDPDGSVIGMNNTDNLYGGAGNDTYYVFEAKDKVIELAGQGADKVFALEMDYTLPDYVEALVMSLGYSPDISYRGTGNALNNVITVEEPYAARIDYVLDGAGGDDVIYGCDTGNDRISGSAGNDTLYGKQADLLNGGGYDDADVIRGGTGNDLIYGGGGDKDTWDGNDVLYGDDGNDRIFGSFGNDRMYGGTGDDELGGQAGNDTMYGGAGRDKLGGGTGNDLLYGDADADVLAGREGLDRLTGGTGNDIFDYDAVTDSRSGAANRDVILDFVGVGAAVGDRVDLSTIDANTTRDGNQAFVFKGTGAITGAGQVHVIASGGDTLIQANTGGSLAPELEILVKDGAALPGQWVAGDFIL